MKLGKKRPSFQPLLKGTTETRRKRLFWSLHRCNGFPQFNRRFQGERVAGYWGVIFLWHSCSPPGNSCKGKSRTLPVLLTPGTVLPVTIACLEPGSREKIWGEVFFLTTTSVRNSSPFEGDQACAGITRGAGAMQPSQASRINVFSAASHPKYSGAEEHGCSTGPSIPVDPAPELAGEWQRLKSLYNLETGHLAAEEGITWTLFSSSLHPYMTGIKQSQGFHMG